MDVKVSKKNIKYGRRENAHSCPIALALKGMGFKRVAVRRDEVLIAKDKTCYEFQPSERAFTFIERFDDYVDKKHFKPTTFRLSLRKKLRMVDALDIHGEFWKE